MSAAAPRILRVEVLSRVAFAPFGEVIEPANARATFAINNGTAQRYHDIARVDAVDGEAVIGLVHAQPRPLPFDVVMLERHPLGSQAFVPLSHTPYLVVVADAPEGTLRCFRAERGQGVNYKRGTWHHPLLALERASEFLVLDRGGPGANCDEAALPETWRITVSFPGASA